MARFPLLQVEPTVQVGDKTRLDASKSFVTPDEAAISRIDISPNGAASAYIDCTDEGYLDWCYSASGTYSPKVRIQAGAASASGVATASISVVTSASDYLFSTDADLKLHESDILKWCEQGRSSFLNIHRRAQSIILKWLDKEGYVDINEEPFTKAAVVDIEEVKQWSTYLVLRLIFEGLSNAVDDVFARKAEYYSQLETEWRQRAILRLDVDGDGVADDGEGVDPAYGSLFRR